MSWRPLSVRSDPEASATYDVLHDGVPTWMLSAATEWVRGFLLYKGHAQTDILHAIEQHLRIRLPRGKAAYQNHDLVNSALALLSDPSKGLDLVDFCLSLCSERGDYRVRELQATLDSSASAWTVGQGSSGEPCLERRVDPTVEAAAKEEMSQAGRAATYLRSAWHGVYGRDPNPSAAYHDAIRAVEAAARSIVTPKDDLATLGKMITAIGDAPHKWTTEIGDVETIRKMMQTVWQAQHDRHGTDDETKPVNVSQPEAEAAVQMAVTLVHLFRSGAIRVVSTP